MPSKKKTRKAREPVPTAEFLIPRPDAEAIAKLRESYRKRTGEEISEDDAREVLSRIMRFQYMNILINTSGLPPMGPAPLGYRVAPDRRWEEDPHDGPLVRRALEMRAAGATIRAICAEMAAAGLRSRRGKEIGPSSMLKVLANGLYDGTREGVPRLAPDATTRTLAPHMQQMALEQLP